MARLGWVVAGCLAIAVGCGRTGPNRVPVTGKVTYRSEPVRTGDIRFIPIKGTQAPMWAADIRDGQYTADAKGGVPVGEYKVEILAWRAKKGYVAPANVPPGVRAEDLAKEQYLPAKYNSQSELEITIASGSGKIVRDFVLAN